MKVYVKSAVQSFSDMDWKDRIAFAEDPDTSSEVLLELISDDSTVVNEYIANNPNATEEVFNKLIEIGDTSTLRTIALSGYTPSSILHKLADIPYYGVRQCVASHPTTKLKTLKKIVKNSDEYEVLKGASTNPNADKPLLMTIAEKNYDVIPYILDNRNVDHSFLEEMARHPNHFIREKLAECHDITDDIMEILSNDSDYRVRWSLAENRELPLEILQRLSEDPNEDVSFEARYQMRHRR